MRKLTLAVGVAILATMGMVGRVDAQQFYPKTPTTPARVDGAYGRASQYPTYPPQYPTASRARKNDSRYNNRERDRDDDGRWRRNHDRRYDQRSGYDNRYGYGSTASSGVPSRVGEHDSSARPRSGSGVSRDSRWDRDGR